MWLAGADDLRLWLKNCSQFPQGICSQTIWGVTWVCPHCPHLFIPLCSLFLPPQQQKNLKIAKYCKAIQVCREHRDRLFLTLFFQLIKCHFDKNLLLRKDTLNEAKQAFSNTHPHDSQLWSLEQASHFFSVAIPRLYNAESLFFPSCPALHVVFLSNKPY